MKRKPIAIILALAMAVCLGATPAWAYFTWNDAASGGTQVKFQPDTTIHEKYAAGEKSVTISNSENAGPAYVRVKVFASKAFDSVTASGENWDPSSTTVNGESVWIYYNDVLQPGAETDALKVNIKFPTQKIDNADDPYVPADGENYSVIVVYEATPVVYDAAGNAQPADWSQATSQTIEGGN